jgi:predicted  nucleic acid-binding Zn-ribbon protein
MKKANEEAINSTGDKLVEGLKQEYETKKTEELKRIEEEKEDDIKDLDDQIDELQEQLDELNNSSTDNKTKLAKLKAERQLWLKDDSTESTKKVSELDSQIAELEKTIKKDDIQSQIDELNKKKSNREDDYEDEKQAVEDKYKDLEDEHKLYNEAEELLTTQNVERIKQLLSSQDESFKQIGTKLGSALTDPIQAEIDKTLKAINDLKTSVGINSDDTSSNSGNTTSNNSSSNGMSKVWISDGANTQIYTDPTGTQSKGSLWSNGIASADQLLTNYEYDNGFYKIYDENGNELGWVERAQVNKWNDIASASSGGRTPSNIGDEGAIMKLHKDEMIANADDTLKFDEMYNYIKNSGSLITQYAETYSSGQVLNPVASLDLLSVIVPNVNV